MGSTHTPGSGSGWAARMVGRKKAGRPEGRSRVPRVGWGCSQYLLVRSRRLSFVVLGYGVLRHCSLFGVTSSVSRSHSRALGPSPFLLSLLSR